MINIKVKTLTLIETDLHAYKLNNNRKLLNSMLKAPKEGISKSLYRIVKLPIILKRISSTPIEVS